MIVVLIGDKLLYQIVYILNLIKFG